MLLLNIGLGPRLGSDKRAMISNSHSGPARECLKSHVTVECTVINHHPFRCALGIGLSLRAKDQICKG